ncbi:hypothetical protein NBRC13296_01515 [Paenibacillus chitinolyticus]|uniref:right-handed parallel beta-helix repeat-containing protein n=1 Tax=Paenibacillus chitinolyticus TaxID=79263 RepID=UPI0035572949
MLLVLILAVSSVFTTTSPVAAADDFFYVSANGSDSNAGTKDAPFATIDKALTSVVSTSTIVLLNDITLNQKLSISVTGKVTIRSEDGNLFSILRGENNKDTLMR